MNNVISQRFQQNHHVPNMIQAQITQINEEPKKTEDTSKIIEPAILREKLIEKLNPKPQIIESAPQPSCVPNPVRLELVHFASLYEFVHWYENNKILFSDVQQKPLDTLIEARNITMAGCNCDKNKRKLLAEDYFKTFWLKNKTTDLLPTLQKNLNTKKLLIGNFISYPE